MQAAKDTFLIALCERLAALNPQRTVVIADQERPAIAAAENESIAVGDLRETFVLSWGESAPADPNTPGLHQIRCTIAYWTPGTLDSDGADRGRRLGTLDAELRAVCSPPSAMKRDYSSDPAAALGSIVLWTAPEFDPVKETNARLHRTARVKVFFFLEEPA